MILVINDPHLADKPPGERTSGYLRDISLKMMEAAKIANEHADLAVITGDIFHHKVARNVTHNVVRVAIALFRRFKDVRLVLGNHDIIGAQPKTRARQPIGVLLESGAVRRLGDLGTVEIGDVELAGVDYSEDFEKGRMKCLFGPTLPKKKRILFMHSMLSPKSWLRDQVRGSFNLVCYGHPHMDEGHIDRFVNFGALARTTQDNYNRRKVKVTLIDEDLSVKPIIIKTQRPWQEIYEETVEDKEQEKVIEDFLAVMEQDKEQGADDLIAYLESLRPEIQIRVRAYIGSV